MHTSFRENREHLENSIFRYYDRTEFSDETPHSHQQYELILSIGNTGTKFVGDHVSSLLDADLCLIGPGLTHCWYSDPHSEGVNDRDITRIQFEKDFIGDDFFSMPEMKIVKDLLIHSSRGVVFSMDVADRMQLKIKSLADSINWLKIVGLLSVICELAESSYNVMASQAFIDSSQRGSGDKVSDIYSFLITNHHRDITLSEIAEFSNMNTSAFCRYIKKATSSTFSDILNNIRVGFACKKLLNSTLSISEIGYSCGYHNITYFNRQFRAIKKLTPSEYRLKFNLGGSSLPFRC